MIRRIVMVVGLGILLGGCLPGTASAHVLKNDGDIGAVMHVEPDDNPLAGVPVTYQLVFNDTSHRFSLSTCDCTATIQTIGGVVKTEAINTKHELDSKSTVTFPEPDVYTLRVRGEPKVAGAFQPFTLNYTIRVNPGGVQFQEVPPLLWAGLGSAVMLAILAAYKEEHDNSKQQQTMRGK